MRRRGGPGYDTRTMGTLSASILAADLARLGDQVKLVEPHAQVFHVDIMDGHFVPPIALGTVVVRSLRPVTQRPLHGHLMVDAPESFFDELRDAGLDTVSFHLEAVPEPGPAIAKARDAGLRVGLTLNLETAVEAVRPYLELIDDVMLMSIRPGWSGQPLNPEVYPRLEAVRNDVDRGGLAIDVEIDGGVKLDNAQRAVDAGATVLVSASGIFHQPDPAAAAASLAAIAGGAR
jgi:ribulose-phosphate 3-epimerase